MRIAFLGLGNMGIGMARNLARAGHEVLAWNRTPAKMEDLARDGVEKARSIADAAVTGMVCSMLADDAAVEAVVFGEGGLLRTMKRGGLHISMSTISRALAERLEREHAAAGQEFVSAPVFGRPEAAANQQLLIVAAGDAKAVERAQPILETMGRKVVTIGTEPWQANVLKLCGNFTIACMLETLSEAFVIARKSGIDPGQFLNIVNGELFRSPVYENYGRLILSEKFEPAGFRAALGLKDVRLTLAAAEAAEAPMPFASVLRDQFLAVVAKGDGDRDWAALSEIAAERAGLDR